MPDNATITPGTGKTVLADEVTDATLGTGVVQMVKIMDGTLDGTAKAAVGANGLAVDTELPAAAALTDADANPTAPTIGAALMAWTGAAWKRVATAAALDARFPPSGPGVMAFPFVYNGTSWDMQRGDIANGLDVDVTRLPALVTGDNVVGRVKNTDGTNVAAVKAASTAAGAADPALVVGLSPNSPAYYRATDLVQVANPVANTAVTITLPAVAGLFHYITRIRIARLATAALAGSAALSITTTNLPGPLAFAVGNAMAAGATQVDMDGALVNPLKSSAVNTATTIVLPAPGLGVLWSAQVFYYSGA